jgi:hypothetical protein
MSKEEIQPMIDQIELTDSTVPNFNPHFLALLEHIGQVIAKDLIEKAQLESNQADAIIEKQDR